MGEIAYVDLSTGKVVAKEIPLKVRKMYLGGRGLDMYLLYNHVKPGIDALGPENVLLVSAGLLVGAPAPGAGRTHIGGNHPSPVVWAVQIRGDFKEVIAEMYRRIAEREGLGDILAEGMLRAIDRIDGATPYYGLNIQGLGAIASDERATPALALGVATATRGSDHLRSRPTIDFFHLPAAVLKKVFGGPVSSDFTSYEGKSYEIYFTERLYALVDALGICKFQTRAIMSPSTPAFEEYAPLIYNITGLEFSPSELMTIGERIYAIERMFNIREGFSRKDDYLPDRYYDEKTPPTGGMPLTRNVQMDRVKFDKMLDEYYELHHWDNQGNPLPERLEELELNREPSHML